MVKRKKRTRKFANGKGSIYKLSGKNRTKPFAVAVTEGWTDKGKQKQKIIGYVTEWEDGIPILQNYFKDPSYNVDFNKLMFKEAFEMWSNSVIPDVTMSSDNKANYVSAFNNHCISLYKIKIIELKTLDIQNCVNTCTKGYSTKRYIRLIASQVYNYCTNILDMELKRNFSTGIDIGEQEESEMHKPFTLDEIRLLWENINIPYVDSILISIYFGLRPSELLKIKLEKVYLDDNYMIGGIKTKAGKNRPLPINREVKPLIEKLVKTNSEYLIERDGKPINYNYYLKYIFNVIMEKLGLNHKPHDGRHTLATELNNVGANDVCTSMILGHEIQGITKGVYTHKTIQQLVDTINLISFK